MAASREFLVFSSWGLDDGDQGNTVSLPRPPGSQHPGHCRSKCDVASSAIAVTPEQSCPQLETVAGGDRAPAAGCGLGGEEVTEQGARQGSGADPSWQGRFVLSQLGVKVDPRTAKLRAGLSRVQWVLSVQGSVLFFLDSTKLDSDDLADGHPDSRAALYASPQPGRRRETRLA